VLSFLGIPKDGADPSHSLVWEQDIILRISLVSGASVEQGKHKECQNLSLNKIKNKYYMTYDSVTNDCFVVHKEESTNIFMLSDNGVILLKCVKFGCTCDNFRRK
jgi:hypothetical protein